MPHPTKIKLLILLIFVVFFQISCEKDTDLFAEAILLPENPIELENGTANEEAKDSLVSKTALLSPINDAYIQEGKGYDDQIIRVQTNDRTSYLMFDLSAIEGELENVELQLTIDSDAGDGTIKIFKGTHNDWSEDKLTATSAPSKDSEIATVSKTFNTGVTEDILINKSLITTEMISFVLEQENGNDFSITSKENPNKKGPKLSVTYRTKKDSKDIEPQEEPTSGNETQSSSTDGPLADELKAFPSAEGYGKYATGGRGGSVIHVTNLNDSGAGSLREAVEVKSGRRTVVFDVSGYINLREPLKIRDGHGDITIAGQTAPGDGITIKGSSFWIHDSNVIIRYLKIRPGVDALNTASLPPSSPDYEPDDAIRIVAWNNTRIENVIIDHCSFSWGRDELLEIGTQDQGYISNVSIQNTILSENIDKGYATLIYKNATNISFHKNLLAHCNDRNIAINANGVKVEMVNNIIYGFNRGTWMSFGNKMDVIGNVYIKSSSTSRSLETIRLENTGLNNSIDNSLFYLNDNIENGSSNSVQSLVNSYRSNNRINNSGLNILSSYSLKNILLPTVGASINRDAIDTRIINDVTKLTGNLIKNELLVGGFPSITNYKRDSGYDTDKDGMTDSWEIANSLDPSNPTDAQQDRNNDGYTNLEEFLHSLTS